MRAIHLAAVGLSALALSACVSTVQYDGVSAASADGAALRTVATLDCPLSEGALMRTGQTADGQSCDYRDGAGEAVTLRLVALDGRPAAEALAPARAELLALIPVSNPPIPPVSPDEPGRHERIDMPFFHVHQVGDHSDVRIFGVKIHSDGDKADVDVSKGSKHTIVHAGSHGAEVMVDDVGRTNAAFVYVLTSERPTPSGYRAVGYIARGPVKGPLVVAEFRASRKHGDESKGHSDLDRLIERNIKGA